MPDLVFLKATLAAVRLPAENVFHKDVTFCCFAIKTQGDWERNLHDCNEGIIFRSYFMPIKFRF